jgi:glycerol-3-phosphate dehydrogenase
VLQSAARRGAQVANYTEAVAFERNYEKITGVAAIDRIGGRQLLIRARQILNATGPWVDAVCRLAGETGGPFLKPTKGVHLVVPDRGFTSAFLLLHPVDGRVMFVIPWLGKTLIGTTDTFEDNPEHLDVTPEEIDYLLQAHNHYFTSALAPADVIGSFAGLRPLIRARPNEPSALSREFRIFRSSSGLLSVAGGKYTTYRHMAEVITNRIVRRLGRRARCRTQHFHLDGAPGASWPRFAEREVWSLRSSHGLSEEAARHLVHRYGRRAADVASYLQRDPSLARPAVDGEPDLLVEFAYQRDHEMALMPQDFLLRRTRVGLFHPKLLHETPPWLAPSAVALRG